MIKRTIRPLERLFKDDAVERYKLRMERDSWRFIARSMYRTLKNSVGQETADTIYKSMLDAHRLDDSVPLGDPAIIMEDNDG